MGKELSYKQISRISLIVYLALFILSLFLMCMPGGRIPWFCVMGLFALPPIIAGPKLYRILGIIALIVSISLCFVDYQLGKVHDENIADSFFEALEKDWDIDEQDWARCKILIPKKDMKIFLDIRPSHPFLAEFERKIVLVDSFSDEIYIPIVTDTGGDTQLKVYCFFDNDQTYLKLSGRNWCVLDLSTKELYINGLTTKDSLFDSVEENLAKAKYYEGIDWQYIGVVKYDKPLYEKNLVFEPNGDVP